MKKSVLVIGGTGKTGRRVAERLSQKDYEVRIGSRSAEIPFDWHEPRGWGAALEGMDMVYITYQPDLAVPGALEAIEELSRQLKNSNVQKVVILSGKGEKEAELCEQVIIHSGIDYTIVRASWFNQNFSESFFLDPIIAGHVALPQAEAQVPYVDADDIADVVTASLLDQRHNGKTYELTGPDLLTFEEIVEVIARETSRDIVFTPITMEAYINILKGVGLPDDYIWLINYLFTEVLINKDNSVVTNDIEKVLGRKPRSFSQYVKETAAKGIWQPAA